VLKGHDSQQWIGCTCLASAGDIADKGTCAVLTPQASSGDDGRVGAGSRIDRRQSLEQARDRIVGLERPRDRIGRRGRVLGEGRSRRARGYGAENLLRRRATGGGRGAGGNRIGPGKRVDQIVPNLLAGQPTLIP